MASPDQIAQMMKLSGGGGLMSMAARNWLQQNNGGWNGMISGAANAAGALANQAATQPSPNPSPMTGISQALAPGLSGLFANGQQPPQTPRGGLIGTAMSMAANNGRSCPTCGQPMMTQLANTMAPAAGNLMQMAGGSLTAPAAQPSASPNATSYGSS